jgi:uncharacterized protein (DUF1499 family)
VRKVPRILVALVATLIIAIGAGRGMGLFSGKRPDSLGVTAGRLAPCKPSPNCVSSQADAGDAVHHVAPLAAGAVPERAFAALKREVRATPRVTIVTEESQYLYAEYRSLVFGFVDDVEFLLDPVARVIHVRSASRLGHGDLGVNRARVERLRARLAGRHGAP